MTAVAADNVDLNGVREADVVAAMQSVGLPVPFLPTPKIVGSVEDLAFSPGGKLLATGLKDKTVKTWSLNLKVAVATFRPHSGRPSGGIRLVGPGAHSAGPSARFAGNPAE